MKVFSQSKWLVHAWERLYTNVKWATRHVYDFGFSRRFVLVRVWYLSSSEAYTNNWGLFGKENYLTLDWWKHFLKILRRSEVTINLTRPFKKMEASEFLPLLYYIVYFFSDPPSPCGNKDHKTTYQFYLQLCGGDAYFHYFFFNVMT